MECTCGSHEHLNLRGRIVRPAQRKRCASMLAVRMSYEQSVTWCTCVILCLGPTPTEPGGWLAESSALVPRGPCCPASPWPLCWRWLTPAPRAVVLLPG